MIGSLMEIAIAYNMIDDVTSEDSTLNPLDMHYLKLKCDIDVSHILLFVFNFICV